MGSRKVVSILTVVVVLIFCFAATPASAQDDAGSATGIYLPLITVADPPPTPAPPPKFTPVLAQVRRANTLTDSAACLEEAENVDSEATASAPAAAICPVEGAYWALQAEQTGQQAKLGFGGFKGEEPAIWTGGPGEFDLQEPTRKLDADVLILRSGAENYITGTLLYEGEGPFVFVHVMQQNAVLGASPSLEPSIFEIADFVEALKNLIEAGNDVAALIGSNVPFYEPFSFQTRTLGQVGEPSAIWIPTGRIQVEPIIGYWFIQGYFPDPRVGAKMGEYRWMLAPDLMKIASVAALVETYRAKPKEGKFFFSPEGVYVLSAVGAGGILYYGIRLIEAAGGAANYAAGIFMIIPERLLNPCYATENMRKVCEITDA